MSNPFPYTLDNKRYHTYNYYLRKRFGQKVSKVLIDADFTCPNRDGKCGYGGCLFCSAKGSGDTNLLTHADLLKQYEENKKMTKGKWESSLFIPYFQAFSNTYGPLSKIKGMLKPFIDKSEVAEIAIATRPDCLPEDILNYLEAVNRQKPLSLELGLQTSNDHTAELINRGYDFNTFKNALYALKKRNIRVCVHIINGLPFEDLEMMENTVKDLQNLPFDGIKIHMLHVLKDSPLGLIYRQKPFKLLSKEEYIELTVKQLELLRPEVVIERLTGDPLKDELLAPAFVANKKAVLNGIDKLMQEKDSFQGKSFIAGID